MSDDPLVELRQAIANVKQKRADEQSKSDAQFAGALRLLEPVSSLLDAVRTIGIEVVLELTPRYGIAPEVRINFPDNLHKSMRFAIIGEQCYFTTGKRSTSYSWSVQKLTDHVIGILLDDYALEERVERIFAPTLRNLLDPDVATGLAPVIAHLADR